MKKIIAVLLSVCLMAGAACASAGCKHNHDFEDGWTSDGAGKHYHKAKCEHTEEKGGEENCDLDNADRVCLKCGYHAHSFEDGWTSDGAGKHYHKAECGHTDVKSGEENCVLNADYVCTKCGYEDNWLNYADSGLITNLSADGYVRGNIGDFSVYEGTAAYRVVTNAEEFGKAIADAKWHYTTTWNGEDKPITQSPAEGYTEENFKGTVHVIEIANDLELGYNKLSAAAKATGSFEDIIRNQATTRSSMATEYGMTHVKVENINDLLIFSKNGSKITHAGFKVNSCNNVAVRNLKFDEMWEWEDAASTSSNLKIGDYDTQKWSYFKINFCGYVWIDHCTFGKSFDGLIDYANPNYLATEAMANVNRAPYGLTGEKGVHLSWCNFESGSDDQNGYIYKMMREIEDDYLATLTNPTACKYQYYKALRDRGITFEQILYGMAMPQKKAFLCGDSGDNDKDYQYNLELRISFANCYFKNIKDRIPKLRGGNGYMYNCYVDSLQCHEYESALSNAQTYVSAANKNWKAATVSQCLLCSNGGSLKAENCIFLGIKSLIKNNDSGVSGDKLKAYYQIVNCRYQESATSTVIEGSSSDTPNKFTATGSLYTEGFSWRTPDGNQPFTPAVVELDALKDYLDNKWYGVGGGRDFKNSWLKSDYSKA